MITLSDQILNSMCLPLDPRLTNLVLVGGDIIVESKPEYLLRTDLYSRYLGMEVSFLTPSGKFELNDFILKVNSNYFKKDKYIFSKGITDEHFIKEDFEESSQKTRPFTINLSNGRYAGKYNSGDTVPGFNSFQELIEDLFVEYIRPEFYNFYIKDQPNIVEIGTTINGSKTFSWLTKEGSGKIDAISIIDINKNSSIITSSLFLNQITVTVPNKLLNYHNQRQSWKVVAVDENSPNKTLIESNDYSMISKYFRFYGKGIDPNGVTSIDRRSNVLGQNSEPQEFEKGSFIMNTGIQETSFFVCLPPGLILTSAVDRTVNAVVEFIKEPTYIMRDAGDTDREYNLYIAKIAIPYSTSHDWEIFIDLE